MSLWNLTPLVFVFPQTVLKSLYFLKRISLPSAKSTASTPFHTRVASFWICWLDRHLRNCLAQTLIYAWKSYSDSPCFLMHVFKIPESCFLSDFSSLESSSFFKRAQYSAFADRYPLSCISPARHFFAWLTNTLCIWLTA